MYLKTIYTLISISLVYLLPNLVGPVPYQELKNSPSVLFKKELSVKPELPTKLVLKNNTTNKLSFLKIPFMQLPGWNKANAEKSLLAFQSSCKIFLKQAPNHPVGSQYIPLQAGDWYAPCKAALSFNASSKETIRAFFEKWFSPVAFQIPKTKQGIFTGYYMPTVSGSLTKTKKFNTPIYGLPSASHSHYTRAEIDKGALNKKAPIIAWINSPVERLFLETEGSGVIKLENGKKLYLGYAGENGQHYSAIGNILIKNGVFTKDNASTKAIKRYLDTNSQKKNALLQQNKSFVFFENLKQPIALGAQGIALTPGYSLAIDRKWIPLGAPLWLVTKQPQTKTTQAKPFQRLMIAQDTGGAIRGAIRGDIYWGYTAKAIALGQHMKDTGYYWLLLPKKALNRLAL